MWADYCHPTAQFPKLLSTFTAAAEESCAARTIIKCQEMKIPHTVEAVHNRCPLGCARLAPPHIPSPILMTISVQLIDQLEAANLKDAHHFSSFCP